MIVRLALLQWSICWNGYGLCPTKTRATKRSVAAHRGRQKPYVKIETMTPAMWKVPHLKHWILEDSTLDMCSLILTLGQHINNMIYTQYSSIVCMYKYIASSTVSVILSFLFVGPFSPWNPPNKIPAEIGPTSGNHTQFSRSWRSSFPYRFILGVEKNTRKAAHFGKFEPRHLLFSKKTRIRHKGLKNFTFFCWLNHLWAKKTLLIPLIFDVKSLIPLMMVSYIRLSTRSQMNQMRYTPEN